MVTGSVLNWLKNYLKNRTQSVNYDSFTSLSLPLAYGVPQGSILVPLLFLLYTSDLHKIISIHDLSSHAMLTILGFIFIFSRSTHYHRNLALKTA